MTNRIFTHDSASLYFFQIVFYASVRSKETKLLAQNWIEEKMAEIGPKSYSNVEVGDV